jgi:hypothetical protein
MPDPIDVLPYELWISCITLAISGLEAGPLELLAVSRRWERLLLDTPSFWSHIYVLNGEDEIARISVFLYFSRGCSLHVDIMTALPSMDGLQLVANQISRVATISIRPCASDTVTALCMERWIQVASYILEKLSNDPLASDVKDTSCFGISLWEHDRLYYCVVLMQFTMVTTGNTSNEKIYNTSAELPAMAHFLTWEEHLTRYALMLLSSESESH